MYIRLEDSFQLGAAPLLVTREILLFQVDISSWSSLIKSCRPSTQSACTTPHLSFPRIYQRANPLIRDITALHLTIAFPQVCRSAQPSPRHYSNQRISHISATSLSKYCSRDLSRRSEKYSRLKIDIDILPMSPIGLINLMIHPNKSMCLDRLLPPSPRLPMQRRVRKSVQIFNTPPVR